MSLNSSKGVAVATVLFILISQGTGNQMLFDMGIVFILYSLVLSTFVAKLSRFFIGVKQ